MNILLEWNSFVCKGLTVFDKGLISKVLQLNNKKIAQFKKGQRIWMDVSPPKKKHTYEKLLNVIVIRRLQIMTTVKYQYTPIRITKILKLTISSICENGEELNSDTFLVGL